MGGTAIAALRYCRYDDVTSGLGLGHPKNTHSNHVKIAGDFLLFAATNLFQMQMHQEII